MGWPKLKHFLKRCFLDHHDEGKVSRLELRQIVHGEADAVVYTWSFEEEQLAELDDLAQDIFTTAQADGEEHDGPTRYTVLAFFGGSPMPSARCASVRILSAVRSHGDFEETEPSNSRGLVAQQMRHTEVLMRQLVAMSGVQVDHAEKSLSRAYRRIEHLEEERSSFVDALEDLAQSSHDRQLEEADHKAKLKRREEMFEQVKILGPAVVNRLTGQKLLPESSTPQEEMIGELLSSLNPTQLETLRSIFTPAQMIAFGELFKARADAEAARKAERDAN